MEIHWIGFRLETSTSMCVDILKEKFEIERNGEELKDGVLRLDDYTAPI
jgi:hypothetical protein